MKKAFVFEILGVAAVLLMTLLHSYAQEDVWLWDEAFYLARGIDPANYGFPTWPDSPAHSGLYALINRMTNDPISAYLVGRAIQAAAFVGCVWIAGKLILRPYHALMAAALVSIVPITYGWPGVSNIASGLIIIAIVLLLRNTNPNTFGTVAILLWIAASSRPEITYAALAASVFAVTWLFYQLHKETLSRPVNTAAFTIVGAVALPLFLTVRYGNIFGRFDREWTAFSQHYGLRNSTSGMDVWMSGSDAVARDFPNSNSILQAFVENPSRMSTHIIDNLLLAPQSFIGNTLGFNAEQISEITISKLGLIGFFGISLVLFILNWRAIVSELKILIQHVLKSNQRPATLLTALVILFSSVSLLVIYPRAHYQLVALGLLTLTMFLLLQSLSQINWISRIPFAWITIAFLIISVQSILSASERIKSPPIFEASLREIDKSVANKIILSRDQPITLFLTAAESATDPRSESTFSNAITRAGINVILRSTILDESGWGMLEGYSTFFENPGEFDFETIIPGSPFLVRKN